ncbi:hypothetical protein [Candidatus Nitrosotenuis chungbukensis]|uniref:hypothetical protein n=1 Tax=Candidatus Nitrosotenuis chungbukensis TaxID=1353246 RepID=UPI0005B2C9AE|nr:hypothetical protein [Candidatus Nitrosotenuis chungbukensis]
MKKTIAVFALLVLILPAAPGFAQMTDTPSSSKVKLTGGTFSYSDDEGYTVVLGEVENTMTFPVTNVKIWVGFYGDGSSKNPLETSTGTTLLTVVQPHAKSPFMIKSKTPDPEITQVSANILGFNSGSPKQQLLEVIPSALSISDVASLDGTITNKGQQSSVDTQVHLISYDAFSPPRVVGIQTVLINELKPNTTYDFGFEGEVDPRAVSFKVIAESDNYQSKLTPVTDVSVDIMTRLITINDIQVLDESGEHLSKIRVGTPVDITSTLSIQDVSGGGQQYVYYAQVKQFGERGTVEFLGIAEGTFDSAQQTPHVTWVPENEGGFFIETFVWDQNGVALASQSSTVSVILVTP